MRKLVLLIILILLLKPVFAFSYAGELTADNETYSLTTSLSFEGRDYSLYGIYQGSQERLIVIQDSLDNLVTSNETIKGIIYAYGHEVGSDYPNLLFNRIQEKKELVENKISEIENITPQYQALILNLSSQGIDASKSIKLFSEVQDLVWQSKILLSKDKFNSADKILEDAKKLAPRITLDIRSSFRINEGSLTLEKVLSDIIDARKQGYDTKSIEDDFDSANSLLTEAKNSYMKEDYDSVDAKISSVLDEADKISLEIKNLNLINPIQQNVPAAQPTGLMIADYSWVSYLVGIAIIVIAAIVILKVSRRKKELRGISKLVRIKSRLE